MMKSIECFEVFLIISQRFGASLRKRGYLPIFPSPPLSLSQGGVHRNGFGGRIFCACFFVFRIFPEFLHLHLDRKGEEPKQRRSHNQHRMAISCADSARQARGSRKGINDPSAAHDVRHSQQPALPLLLLCNECPSPTTDCVAPGMEGHALSRKKMDRDSVAVPHNNEKHASSPPSTTNEATASNVTPAVVEGAESDLHGNEQQQQHQNTRRSVATRRICAISITQQRSHSAPARHRQTSHTEAECIAPAVPHDGPTCSLLPNEATASCAATPAVVKGAEAAAMKCEGKHPHHYQQQQQEGNGLMCQTAGLWTTHDPYSFVGPRFEFVPPRSLACFCCSSTCGKVSSSGLF